MLKSGESGIVRWVESSNVKLQVSYEVLFEFAKMKPKKIMLINVLSSIFTSIIIIMGCHKEVKIGNFASPDLAQVSILPVFANVRNSLTRQTGSGHHNRHFLCYLCHV